MHKELIYKLIIYKFWIFRMEVMKSNFTNIGFHVEFKVSIAFYLLKKKVIPFKKKFLSSNFMLLNPQEKKKKNYIYQIFNFHFTQVFTFLFKSLILVGNLIIFIWPRLTYPNHKFICPCIQQKMSSI